MIFLLLLLTHCTDMGITRIPEDSMSVKTQHKSGITSRSTEIGRDMIGKRVADLTRTP